MTHTVDYSLHEGCDSLTYNGNFLNDWNVDGRHEVNGSLVTRRHHDTAQLEHSDVIDTRQLVPDSTSTAAQDYPTHVTAGVAGLEVDS